MELTSRERQRIRQLIERLQLSSTHLTVPAEDSRGIQMVKNDIDYIADELQEIVEESWAIVENDDYIAESLLQKPREPEIPSYMVCEHHKVYAPFMYTGMTPKTPWICSKCLKQGADEGAYPIPRNDDSYRLLLNEVLNKVKRGEK